MSAALLSTLNLSIGYHQKVILSGMSLSLPAGKLICFMGPNGIGKSTLIRTLAGLQKPLSGTITINSNRDHPSIAVVLTDKISLLYMTVFELVTFGRYPYLNWTVTLRETDKNAIHQSLEQVNLTSLAHKRLHELSDGQLQLAMIARALAQDTEIILLDEPTSHLDLNNRLEIMNLLRDLARTMNKGILIATHELDLALQTADEIWLAGRQQQLLTGLPEDLVLAGSFDQIFELKGFDLKTGKVLHHAHRGKKLRLRGDGFEYRWTRNALERAGYLVTDEGEDPTVFVNRINDNTFQWDLDGQGKFGSIMSLLDHLRLK